MSVQHNAFPAPPPSPPPEPMTHLNDDIFDDSPSTPTSPAHGDRNQDLVKLRSTHVTEGYRAAVSVSKAQFVQAGFDQGYELGGKIGLVAGWVRGVGEGLAHAVAGGVEADAEGGEAKAREVKGLVRELEREVVVERLLGREWIDEEGVWKWEVGRWEDVVEEVKVKGQEGAPPGSLDLDLNLVVQSHPVLRKWVARVTEMAEKLGLDIHKAGEQDAGTARVNA